MRHSIPQFLLITRRGERGTVMVAFGRLALGHGARWGAWTPSLAQATRGPVYVDLGGIIQLDAAGIGVLVRVARRIRRQGRNFCIVAAPPRVRRMLAVTRLLKPLAFGADHHVYLFRPATARARRKRSDDSDTASRFHVALS
jgi:anti-anti-sigma factor